MVNPKKHFTSINFDPRVNFLVSTTLDPKITTVKCFIRFTTGADVISKQIL